MTINDVDTLSNLKKYGSFVETKKIIQDNCGFNVKTRSWKALFEKLTNLQKIISNFDKNLFMTNDFIKSKSKVSKKLGVVACADNLKQLNDNFDKLIIFFTIKIFDPYDEYEKRKVADFKYSSMLEGIHIEDSTEARDNILKKYKVIIDG